MDAAITMHVASAPADLDTFARALRGLLVRPGDEAFRAVSGIWNRDRQGTPLAIVQAADPGDVATAIGFARRNDIEIAVRSGGHSLAGHSTGDGVLVIDTRAMRGLHIDLHEGIAWAGAGLTAGEVTAALAEHGMAVPFGDTATVGIAGLTLGGGIGWLARKYGLAIDSLMAVEIVTPDGEVRTASESQNPDLFWALRGGGGNFGVVTRFCYRLSPVGEVFAGALFMPATRDVMRILVPIASSAPEELTVISALMPAPAAPFIPAEHHGKPSLAVMFVFVGDADAGAAAIAPFRSVATPYGEMVAPMPYPGIYEFTKEAGEPSVSTARSLFMGALDDASVDAILAAVEAAPDGWMIDFRVLGGAVSRVAVDATAFAHRTSPVQVTIINWLGDPASSEQATAWNRSLFAALESKATGVYVNFLEDEGDGRVRLAYPAQTLARLREVKRRYDPANVLRRNQNIRPS